MPRFITFSLTFFLFISYYCCHFLFSDLWLIRIHIPYFFDTWSVHWQSNYQTEKSLKICLVQICPIFRTKIPNQFFYRNRLIIYHSFQIATHKTKSYNNKNPYLIWFLASFEIVSLFISSFSLFLLPTLSSSALFFSTSFSSNSSNAFSNSRKVSIPSWLQSSVLKIYSISFGPIEGSIVLKMHNTSTSFNCPELL